MAVKQHLEEVVTLIRAVGPRCGAGDVASKRRHRGNVLAADVALLVSGGHAVREVLLQGTTRATGCCYHMAV